MGQCWKANHKVSRASTSRRRNVRSTVLSAILATHSVVLLTALPQQGSERQTDSRAHAELRITLEGLLTFLEKHQADDVSEAMAIKLIDLHGLSFTPTADDLERLKRASASSEMLQAIERAKKPPKPEVKTGKLIVACQPVDCAVWLNGISVGSTNAGVLPLPAVPEGSVRISATRADYEPDRKAADASIQPNETTSVEFALRPSREALVAAGRVLFQQMLNSLGSASDPSFDALRASGTLQIDTTGEPRVTWSVVALLSKRSEALFEASRNREKYEITQTPDGYIWKKAPKTKEARKLEDALRLVSDKQLSYLVQRLKDPNVVMIAPDLTRGDPMAPVFRAEASWGTWVITLDTARHPSQIEMESSGLSSGLRVRYSDYLEENGLSYPRDTEVILPNRTSGVKLRFDKVLVSPEDKSMRLPAK